MRFTLFLALAGIATSRPVAAKFTAWVIPHSHDDVGWLKTADQYFQDEVSQIYTTTFLALENNPHRRFTAVEIAFFSRWWNQADEISRTRARTLYATGQLEFNLAGWSMADEACTAWAAHIDNFAIGWTFLRDTLFSNYTGPAIEAADEAAADPVKAAKLFQEARGKVRAGWHIDPFGSSSAVSAIMGMVGFDFYAIGRPGLIVRREMREEQAIQFVWRGAQAQSPISVFSGGAVNVDDNVNTGRKATRAANGKPFETVDDEVAAAISAASALKEEISVFTEVLWDHYTTPPPVTVFGTGWNSWWPGDGLPAMRTAFFEQARDAAAMVRRRGEATTHGHVLIPFGDDFAHTKATRDYAHMDVIVDMINAFPEWQVEMKYSTLHEYVTAVRATVHGGAAAGPEQVVPDVADPAALGQVYKGNYGAFFGPKYNELASDDTRFDRKIEEFLKEALAIASSRFSRRSKPYSGPPMPTIQQSSFDAPNSEYSYGRDIGPHVATCNGSGAPGYGVVRPTGWTVAERVDTTDVSTIATTNAEGKPIGLSTVPELELLHGRHTHSAGTFDEDFMPYETLDDEWWTGYYTSRPWLKALTGDVNRGLRSYDALMAGAIIRDPAALSVYLPPGVAWNSTGAAGGEGSAGAGAGGEETDVADAAAGGADAHTLSAMNRPRDPFAAYRDSVGNMLHHDAVTGTEKNFVALDYAVQIAHGRSTSAAGAAHAASVHTGTPSDDTWKPSAQLIVDMCSDDNSGSRVSVVSDAVVDAASAGSTGSANTQGTAGQFGTAHVRQWARNAARTIATGGGGMGAAGDAGAAGGSFVTTGDSRSAARAVGTDLFVYNPTSWTRLELVSIPLSPPAFAPGSLTDVPKWTQTLGVVDLGANSTPIASQITPAVPAVAAPGRRNVLHPHVSTRLEFYVSVPPMGHRVVRVLCNAPEATRATLADMEVLKNTEWIASGGAYLDNGFARVDFSPATGTAERVTRRVFATSSIGAGTNGNGNGAGSKSNGRLGAERNVSVAFDFDMRAWTGSSRHLADGRHPSGAYVFRPLREGDGVLARPYGGTTSIPINSQWTYPRNGGVCPLWSDSYGGHEYGVRQYASARTHPSAAGVATAGAPRAMLFGLQSAVSGPTVATVMGTASTDTAYAGTVHITGSSSVNIGSASGAAYASNVPVAYHAISLPWPERPLPSAEDGVAYGVVRLEKHASAHVTLPAAFAAVGTAAPSVVGTVFLVGGSSPSARPLAAAFSNVTRRGFTVAVIGNDQPAATFVSWLAVATNVDISERVTRRAGDEVRILPVESVATSSAAGYATAARTVQNEIVAPAKLLSISSRAAGTAVSPYGVAGTLQVIAPPAGRMLAVNLADIVAPQGMVVVASIHAITSTTPTAKAPNATADGPPPQNPSIYEGRPFFASGAYSQARGTFIVVSRFNQNANTGAAQFGGAAGYGGHRGRYNRHQSSVSTIATNPSTGADGVPVDSAGGSEAADEDPTGALPLLTISFFCAPAYEAHRSIATKVSDTTAAAAPAGADGSAGAGGAADDDVVTRRPWRSVFTSGPVVSRVAQWFDEDTGVEFYLPSATVATAMENTFAAEASPAARNGPSDGIHPGRPPLVTVNTYLSPQPPARELHMVVNPRWDESYTQFAAAGGAAAETVRGGATAAVSGFTPARGPIGGTEVHHPSALAVDANGLQLRRRRPGLQVPELTAANTWPYIATAVMADGASTVAAHWPMNGTEPRGVFETAMHVPWPTAATTHHLVLHTRESHGLSALPCFDEASSGLGLTCGGIRIGVHRRCIRDDGYGVAEALVDAFTAKGSFGIDVASDAVSAAEHARLGGAYMDNAFTFLYRPAATVEGARAEGAGDAAITAATAAAATGVPVPVGSVVSGALPINVGVNTLRGVWRGVYLKPDPAYSWPTLASSARVPIYARFEHLFEAGEGPLSVNAEVTMKEWIVGGGATIAAAAATVPADAATGAAAAQWQPFAGSGVTTLSVAGAASETAAAATVVKTAMKGLVEVSLTGTALRAIHARRFDWNLTVPNGLTGHTAGKGASISSALPAGWQAGEGWNGHGAKGRDGRAGGALVLRPREVRAVATTGYEHGV